MSRILSLSLLVTTLLAAASGPSARAQDASAAASQSANQSAPPAKPVCFPLSGRCVEAAKAHQADKKADKKDLDLAAPDVQKVVPADQLKEPLPDAEQITEVQESQTVAVKGESPGPEVPGGFGAIWWALNHPTNAWKIFLPAE